MWNVLSIFAVTRSDPRPFATVCFDNQTLQALVDTGSEITAMDFATFCSLKHRPALKPAPFQIRSASSNLIPIKGMAKLRVSIAGKQMYRTFCILDVKDKRKCIIGADTIYEENLKIRNPLKKSPTLQVWALESCSIPPHSEKTVKIGCKPNTTGTGILSMNSNFPFSNDALVAIKNGKSLSLLQNPTDWPIHIARKENIASVSINSQQNITSFLPSSRKHVQALTKENKSILQDLDLTNIPETLRQQYHDVIANHSDVFSLDPNDIGRCGAIKQDIKLKDPNRIANVPPYRTPFHLRPVVTDYVSKLLATGVLQKSTSPFSSPLMLVRKANATNSQPLVEQYRVVHDYRLLNSNTIRDSYPLHNLYDLIDRVSQAKVWSVIDLSSGFWNQELTKSSQKYTAFGVPGLGHFEYTRSAQGLCNSPPAFQRLLDFLTRGLPQVFVYVDDVVVCSDTHEQHLELLAELFRRFRKYNLKCRLKKVQLGATEINYLGYNLSKVHGIRPGAAKTEAIKHWHLPTTIKEIKQFLGLCSFFRRTIPKFSSISSPLTRLTRKTSQWTKGVLPLEAQQAFYLLKKLLCRRPCLKPVDFRKEFILTIDASTSGFGAVLSQLDDNKVEHPCAYASRALKDPETRYAPFHLEHQAMVWACRHFRPYLAGKHFILRTDHKPLLSLNKTQGAALERLQMELEQYQPFTVQYLKGSIMPADGLSRQLDLNSVSLSLHLNSAQLRDLQKQDLQSKALVCWHLYGKLPSRWPLRDFVVQNRSNYFLKDGILGTDFKGSFLPFAPQSIRENILRLSHDDFTSGHCGAAKTKHRIMTSWHWPSLGDDVTIYCRSCHVCNSTNLPSHQRPVPMESLRPVSTFNERVHIDLLGPLPVCQGAKYLLVCIDAFSKLVELAPLPSKNMEDVAQAFLTSWICRHGVCRTLHSDQGKEFANKLFTSLKSRMSFVQNFSSVAHPQSNGLVERSMRTILTHLRKLLDGSNDWVPLLPFIMSSINTSVHSSTKYTPFMAAYNRPVTLPSSAAGPLHSYADSAFEQQLALSSRIKQEIIKNQQHAFEAQKVQFDKRAKAKDFQLGDFVYLERPKRGSQFQKFQTLYEGPYRITKKGNHFNVFLEPLPSFKNTNTPKIRNSLWTHINNCKLAPFVQQFQCSPDDSDFPSPTLQPTANTNSPQLLDTQLEDNVPLSPANLESQTGPAAAVVPLSGDTPVSPDAPSLTPLSPAGQAETSGHEPPPAVNPPAANPFKRLLRSVTSKRGAPLSPSVLHKYPSERRRTKPVSDSAESQAAPKAPTASASGARRKQQPVSDLTDSQTAPKAPTASAFPKRKKVGKK